MQKWRHLGVGGGGWTGGHRILGGHFQDKILLWRLDYISFSKGLSIIATTNTSILIQINKHLLNYGCSSSISLGNMHHSILHKLRVCYSHHVTICLNYFCYENVGIS